MVAAVPPMGSGTGDENSGAGSGNAEEPSVAASGSSGSGSPPDSPSAPGGVPSDDEIPTNGRLAVIMSAVSEMPLPVQEVVRARLDTAGTEEELGEPLGLTADEVRQLLEQGQAILDRTIGTGFRIRYIGDVEPAPDDPPPAEFPSFDELADAVDETEATDATDERDDREDADGLGQLIARLVEALTEASKGDSPENREARDLLSEALREAGNLFQIASERVEGERSSDTPLRAALAEPRDNEDRVTLIVRDPDDVSRFFMALQSIESVQWARLQEMTEEAAIFVLVIDSMIGLVRDVMAFEGSMRPTRLQISGDEITVELPPVEPVAVSNRNVGQSGQQFELAVDSFFGARHFVDSGSNESPPHHHSYRVEASFVTSQPDNYGFVVGFAQIREMVDSTVMVYSETLLNTEEPFREIPPTTENLARVFHERIATKLDAANHPHVHLKHVRVWESPTNSATYSDPGFDAAATA